MNGHNRTLRSTNKKLYFCWILIRKDTWNDGHIGRDIFDHCFVESHTVTTEQKRELIAKKKNECYFTSTEKKQRILSNIYYGTDSFHQQEKKIEFLDPLSTSSRIFAFHDRQRLCSVLRHHQHDSSMQIILLINLLRQANRYNVLLLIPTTDTPAVR